MVNFLVRRFFLTLVSLSGLYARADQVMWQSGFETAYPGEEWLDRGKGFFSPDGVMPEGRDSAWTIVNRISGDPVLSGNHSYKG